jgi:serine/threonine protein kinase
MNKIVEVLGTPKKEDWPEGYKLAASLRNLFLKQIDYNFPEKKKKNLYEVIPDADLEVIDLLESMLSYSFRKRPSAIEYYYIRT